MIPKDFKRYYAMKRGNSRKRGIDWQLTLEQCWSLWQPYWQASRDNFSQGYCGWCLARNGDRGPYSLENCTIKTHGENSQERWETNRNYQAGLGDPRIQDYINSARPVQVQGKIYSSVGAAGREWGLHKTTVQNRCQSRNFPDWQYVDRPES